MPCSRPGLAGRAAYCAKRNPLFYRIEPKDNNTIIPKVGSSSSMNNIDAQYDNREGKVTGQGRLEMPL